MKIEKIEKEAENIKSGKNVDIDFQVMIERQKYFYNSKNQISNAEKTC